MNLNLEIEFKTLLTYDQFIFYKDYFFKDVSPFTQINEYFGDSKGLLKAKGYSLRIRHLNHTIEFTLKKPQAFAKMEYNEYLTSESYQALLRHELNDSAIIKELRDEGIDTSTLERVGGLSTTRYQMPYQGGQLCLDYSKYKDTCDYEIEYEAANEKEGLTIFKSVLSLQMIEYIRNCPGKISRALG